MGVRTKRFKDWELVFLGTLKHKEGQEEGQVNRGQSAPGRNPAIPREREVRFISDVGRSLSCVILKGLISLQATAAGPGRKFHIPVPSQGPWLLLEESELFLPAAHFSDFQSSVLKGVGEGLGEALCSHLPAVSLTKTWLRRKVQLNSNSNRKVT